MPRRRHLVVLLFGLYVLACSDDPSGQPSPPSGQASPSATAESPRALRTLRAALAAEPASAPEGNLRVAILWDVKKDGIDAKWLRAQDIGIAKTWPVRFSMELAPEPPPEAIEDFVLGELADPSTVVLKQARAKVVVYEDRNANSRFDAIPDGSEERIDVIVGADDDLFLEWVNGTDEGWLRNQYTPGLGLARGMNLVRRPGWGVPLGPECVAKPCEWGSGLGPHALPPDQEVLLATTITPFGQSLACEKFVGIDSSAGDINTPCPSPMPAGRGVMCLAWDRTVYLSVEFPTPMPTCNLRDRIHYCGVRRDAAQPVPSSWPCP